VNLDEFRECIFAEFGPDLHRATPASVNEFLARLDQREYEKGPRGPVELGDSALSYEGAIKEFLVEVLNRPAAQAVVPLWKFAFQLAFGVVEQHEVARLEQLGDPES
jgi:hypothetical protein